MRRDAVGSGIDVSGWTGIGVVAPALATIISAVLAGRVANLVAFAWLALITVVAAWTASVVGLVALGKAMPFTSP